VDPFHACGSACQEALLMRKNREFHMHALHITRQSEAICKKLNLTST